MARRRFGSKLLTPQQYGGDAPDREYVNKIVHHSDFRSQPVRLPKYSGSLAMCGGPRRVSQSVGALSAKPVLLVGVDLHAPGGWGPGATLAAEENIEA